jgi:hypothetical protein
MVVQLRQMAEQAPDGFGADALQDPCFYEIFVLAQVVSDRNS